MPIKKEKKKILVVDDDEFNLAIANAMLSAKYEISIVKSGKAALSVLAKGFVPNLILLDLLMPEMDGWETFNKIKGVSYLHTAPIVFVTSVTDAAEKKRAMKIGAADFITKPFEQEALLEKVKVLAEKHGK